MARAIGGIPLHSPASQVYSLRSTWILRLTLGYTVLFGTLISLFGTAWDIQWHTFVGRDRTLIPPHLMMLSGITLSGVAALLSVIIESIRARRNPLIAENSVSFAEMFYGSLGAYLAGFAALDAAIAFPLDSYWHSLYGIDVAIWAPFHIMILFGMGLTALGATYMLLSGARMASKERVHQSTRTGYIGAIIGFAATLSIFTLLLLDALSNMGFIPFGGTAINVFPLLSGLLISWILVAAVYAIPWKHVALAIVGVYILFGVLFTAFVPPATDYLVTFEHLNYRRHLGIYGHFSIVSLQWPLAIILGAILLDFFYQRAQQKNWSGRRLFVALSIAALIGSLPVIAITPNFTLRLIALLGLAGFFLTILSGVPGVLIGTWFGRRMGMAMQEGK